MKARPWIIGAAGALVVGIAAWRGRHPSAPAHNRPPSTALPPGTVSSAAPAAGASEQDASLLLALAKSFSAPSTADIATRARNAAASEQRAAALGELLNPRYSRAAALRILQAALTDPAPGVRLRAAEVLYALGSDAGKQTLLDLMRSAAAANDTTGLSDAVAAATVLNRFREPIDADLLLQLYRQHPHPGLLGTMAMQGDPRYQPVLLEAAKDEPIAGNILNVGVLGAPASDDFVRHLFAASTDPVTKVAAAWALFRTSADRTALAFVIDHSALVPATVGSVEPSADVVATARRALYVTADAAVTDLLHRTVTAAAADVSSSSLASLFYVQHDDAFVDKVVTAYLTDHSAYPGLDSSLVWRIAAARGAPDLDALARAQNSEAYNLYFVQTKGRPVEGWIWSYLSRIPARH